MMHGCALVRGNVLVCILDEHVGVQAKAASMLSGHLLQLPGTSSCQK